MRTMTWLISTTVVLIAAWVLFARFRPPVPVRRGAFARDRMLNIAHRGGSLEAPENTLYAFERALQAGADALEMDIHQLADGKLFVLHDETLERTTNGSGPAAEKTLAELKTLDAACNWNPGNLREPPLRGTGIQIPSLEEVFQKFPGVPLFIEIKPAHTEMVAELGRLLEKYDRWDETIVGSFHQEILKPFRKQFPQALTSAGRAEVKRFFLLQRIGLAGLIRPPVHSFQIPERSGSHDLLSRGMRKALRRQGMDLHVWTVNEEPDMRRVIGLSVQGIITDRPSVLADVLTARGRA
jgi:glycerophosphoryl diester phosphodiesterase